MWQLLTDDLIKAPSLVPTEGRLTLPPGVGFGFTLDQEVIDESTRLHALQ